MPVITWAASGGGAVPGTAAGSDGGQGVPATGVLPGSSPPITLTSSVKISLATVIDQGLSQDIPLLKDTELVQIRRVHHSQGGPPLPEHDPSDEQLTALKFVVDAGKAPFVDMGVWGP